MRYPGHTSLGSRRRRPLAGAALATIAVACLGAGCTGPGTRTSGPSPWATPSATAATTVTILSGTDTSVSAGTSPVQPGEPGMYSELVDWWNRYEEPVTKIHVVLATVPGGATAEHSEMLADAETGDAAYDIYNLDNEWVPEFAAGNFIWSLQARLPGNGFLAQPLASGTYDGRLYAAPFTTDVGLLYYRTDLVAAPKVTGLTSFKGLVDLATQVLAAHPKLTIGYAGQFASYEGLTVNLLEIIHSYGQDAFGANGTIRDSTAVTQGLTELTDAMTNAPPGVIPSFEFGYTESQAVAAFAAGHAVFMRNWPIYYEQLVTAKGAGSSQVASHVGVATLPFASALGGQDLAIARASSHPAAALQVVRYLTSPQAERCLFAVAGFPATRAAAYATDNALPTGYDGITGHPLCGTQTGPSLVIGQKILDGIDRAFLRPRTRYYTEFSSIIQDQVPALLKNSLGGGSMTDLVPALTTALNAAAAGRAPAP